MPVCLYVLLGALGAVLRAALATIGYTGTIKGATYGVIADARKVLDSTTTNQHNAVFLEVVAFTPDIARDLEAIRQSDSSHLAHS